MNVVWRYSFLLVIVIILVYLPGLSGGFFYDDYHNFLLNPAIQTPGFTLKNIWAAIHSGIASSLGRPLPMLTFYLNYQVGGLEPFGYKLFNLFIHIINTVLIYGITFHLLKRFLYEKQKDVDYEFLNNLAFWIALLWAVHPINLTGVLYIVQRMTSMAGTFTLLGIFAYFILREKKTFALKNTIFGFLSIILFGILALLCKENGLLLFLFLFLIEVFVFKFKFTSPEQKKYITLFFSFVLFIPLVATIFLILNGGISLDYSYRDFNLEQRLLTESRVMWFYIAQIFLPHMQLFGLHHDDFRLSISIIEPATTIWAILGLFILCVMAVVSCKRQPWLSFGILLFIGGHIMESTIFPLNLVHEHRNYIPSWGAIIILCVLLHELFKNKSAIFSRILFLILTVLFSSVTFSRALEWGDMVLYADKTMQRQPLSINTNYDAAFIYMQSFEATNNRYYLQKTIEALEISDNLSKTNMKSAISLMHVLSLSGERQQGSLIEKIELNLANRKIIVDEVIALRQFVNCLSMKICKIKPDYMQRIFTSLFNNPGIQGRLRDDALYIYATYLDSVLQEGLVALNILRDIVTRNPDIIEYKIKLITTLFTYGNDDEAKMIMIELSDKYGYKWDIQAY